MKRKLVISMIALLSMVAMGCSQKQASIENDITTEVIAEVISTEEAVEKEEKEEIEEIEKETEQEQTFDEIEIPYYETYQEFIAGIGLKETEYDLEGMYKYYCYAMELTTPEGAILNCIKNREFFTTKEQTVAKEENKKPSGESKPSGEGNSSSSTQNSGVIYWEEPTRTPEEAQAARDELNASRGGMTSEELKNATVRELTEAEKEIIANMKGY